jgi:type III secretory pathway component EscV
MLLLHMQIRRYFNKICDNKKGHVLIYNYQGFGNVTSL